MQAGGRAAVTLEAETGSAGRSRKEWRRRLKKKFKEIERERSKQGTGDDGL